MATYYFILNTGKNRENNVQNIGAYATTEPTQDVDYKVVFEHEGTFYSRSTKPEIIVILDRARRGQERLRIYYGDTGTGRAWDDRPEVGYIGRSTGPIKIPLIIYNSRSMGGGGILDDCIVKIETSKGKRVLYQHPTFQPSS